MSDLEPQLSALYAASWTRLVRTAFVITQDMQLSEDAVQTAFAKAFASWWRVSRADDPIAYLRRITINAALAAERKSARRRERPAEYVPDLAITAVDDLEATRTAMWSAVQALPPRQRAVVALRYYEDLSELEIATVLGCRPGTVKSQASAALKSLRATLEKQNEWDLT